MVQEVKFRTDVSLQLEDVSDEPKSNGFQNGRRNTGYVPDAEENGKEYFNANQKPKLDAKKVIYSWNEMCAWTGPSKIPPDEDGGYDNPTETKGILGFCKKPEKNKVILNRVSGIIRPGELVALMGASGAGKSTLMDVLTFRHSKKIHVSGQRCVNGAEIKSNTITSISAYVQQQDLFFGVLTVREHLMFQAQVRMDAHIPFNERVTRVEEVIQELGLGKCADSRIGTKWVKGLSGGEQRRLSIASEILTNPVFICLDEPLSGLDSASATLVLNSLKQLANTGKTVLCSVHQPSSQLFNMFDQVMYMTEGRTAYLGPVNDCLEFFNNLGYPCPEHYNPSDFFIETLSVRDDESKEKVKEICEAFDELPSTKETKIILRRRSMSGDKSLAYQKSAYKSSAFTQFRAVLKRSFLSYTRDPMVLKMRFLQAILIGIFVGTIYFQEDIKHVDGIQNLSGAIFMLLCTSTYQNVFGVLDVFCSELPVFLREHFNGMYRTDVYYFSKVLVDIPFGILLPTLQTAISYYMIGFNPELYPFLKSAVILVLVTYICTGVGVTLSCCAKTVTIALLLAPLAIFPFFLFGGFLVRPGSGVVFLRWLQYGSWFFYGYESLAIIQLENVEHIDCGIHNSTCPSNGLAVLESLKFDPGNLERDVMALGAIAIGITVLGYFALLSKTIRR